MHAIYGSLIFMLAIALSMIAFPFIKNPQAKTLHFLFITIFFISFSAILYLFSGNKLELRDWMNQGQQRYHLQLQINKLGGINGMIIRVKENLKSNPNDAQGWMILGKLYLMNNNLEKAKAAFRKAYRLKPQDKHISDIYHHLTK